MTRMPIPGYHADSAKPRAAIDTGRAAEVEPCMTHTEEHRRNAWTATLEKPQAGRHLLLIEHHEDDLDRPPLHPETTKQRIEWAWSKYQRQLDRLSWLDDDRVPYLDCITGTEIFAAAFGCDVFHPEGEMPFAKPRVASPEEADALSRPSLDAPTLAQMYEIADALFERAGQDAVVRLPDVQSPMDIVGIVWDKNDFFISIIEAQDAVLRLAENARELLASFLDEWFARYGHAFVAHYPDYFMPCGVTLSEDEIGSVGPELFESMFLPELNALSRRYGAIGIHCCAHAHHQWDGLARVEGLKLLNLNQPPEILDKAYPFFARRAVQLPVPALLAGPAHERESSVVDSWRSAFHEVGAASVVFSVSVRSDDEARRVADGFREAQASVAERG
jgi:hypothetical protein